MAGDQTNVGGAAEAITIVNVEGVFERDHGSEEVAGGAVHQALGFPGMAMGFKDRQPTEQEQRTRSTKAPTR